MVTQFKTRQQLATTLGVDPKTLRRYLNLAGIDLGKGRLSPKKWDEVIVFFVNFKQESIDSSKRPNMPEKARKRPNMQ